MDAHHGHFICRLPPLATCTQRLGMNKHMVLGTIPLAIHMIALTQTSRKRSRPSEAGLPGPSTHQAGSGGI